MAKQVFHVSNMHCSACVMRLEGIEDELPGVTTVTASYRKQSMDVEYDEAQVTVEHIIVVARNHGYEVIPQRV